MSDSEIDALYEGVQIDDDLIVKAVLRVSSVGPMKHAVTQSLADDLKAKYKARSQALMADIEVALAEDDEENHEPVELVFTNRGSALIKATNPPKPDKAPKEPKSPGVGVSGQKKDRKLTPDGFIHVQNPGVNGGKFWRDSRGNVRYGEQPHGDFKIPASPNHVVEHYKKYIAPNPFGDHTKEDVFIALQESKALTHEDHAFMQWWHDSYDDILETIGTNRKEVEKAGGLQNMTFDGGGRDIGIGEVIEDLFRNNVDMFVGDEDFGELESPEEILKAVRGLMERYNKALHEDPEVQALAQAHAERVEAKKAAFFVQAEREGKAYEPLSADLMTIEDPNDLSVRFSVAMMQLGLIERGKGGKVAQKRMRGAITPKTSMLEGDKALVNNPQIDRLNASQLMALYIAHQMQDSFATDNTYDYHKDGDPAKYGGLETRICARLSIVDPTMRKLLIQKLDNTAKATAKAFTAFNTMQDPHFEQIFKMKIDDVAGQSDAMEIFADNKAKEQSKIEAILKAQDDDKLEIPPTMMKGVWNGKTLKNPEKPEKGVWEPFNYQKKYVNWMMKVKRGIIGAGAGLGKTPTVILFRELLAAKGDDRAAICFLPPSLMEQWPAAVAKFAPDQADKVLNLSGLSLEERKKVLQSPMAKNAKYIFISSGTLTGDVPDPNAEPGQDDGTGGSDHEMVNILKELDGHVFIDEAHAAGYKKAGNTRHEIAKAVMADRDYAFGMTATPMPNDPMDTFHLCNLFAPGSVGDEELWTGRMAGVQYDKATDTYKVANAEHIADLNKRLKPVLFYKQLSDPDVQEDTKGGLEPRRGISDNKELWPDEGDIALSTKVDSENGLSQADYFKDGGVIDTMVKLRINKLIRDRDEKARKGEVNPETGEKYQPYDEGNLNLLAGGMKITLQRQASISPALIDPTFKRNDGRIGHSPKIHELCNDIISHFYEGGQGGKDSKPLVVFCSYPGKAFPLVRKALAERGVDPSLIEQISGEVAPAERGYMQDKLNKGHAKVLLVGTMSGGAGLNLQEAANKTLYLDEPWSPAAKEQASGRVWRTGQKESVYEKTYRSIGTYDMAVEQKLSGKQAMVHALLGKQLPTDDTFDAGSSIKNLLGRVSLADNGEVSEEAVKKLMGKQKQDFSEETTREMMRQAQNYNFNSPEHHHAQLLASDHWKEAAEEGGRGGVGASYTDEDYKPDKAAQKKLQGKGAHALTKQFDEKEFRANWELDRDRRNAKQNYEMANLMQGVFKKEDPDRANQYGEKAKKIAKDFPHVKPAPETKAKTKPKADKKPVKKKVK